MRQAGVIVVPTNDPGRGVARNEWIDNTKRLFADPSAATKRSMESLSIMNHADHEKVFVTLHDEGEVRAILGGLNIASEYALGGGANQLDPDTGRGGWRDTDIEVRGPAAHAVLEDYVQDYEYHVGEAFPVSVRGHIDAVLAQAPPKVGSATVRFVPNHPLAQRTMYTEDGYRVLIQATPAGEPIFIATPYFAPSKVLREAIIAHARLGGEVTILTNTPDSTDVTILTDAAYFAAEEILRETDGVTIYEWIPRTDEGEHTMHQKVASFGHHGPIIVGSFNLDAQSSVHNTESFFIVDDPATRDAFDRMVAEDLSAGHVTRITLERLEAASPKERRRRFLIHELAWYWL